jgi:hypothetical protein
VDDLIAFLRAQYAEDERIARAAAAAQGPVWWYKANLGGVDGRVLAGEVLDDGREVALAEALTARSAAEGVHAARHNPERVLRNIDAKRRTLVRCEEAMLAANPMLVHFAKQTVREMALPYSDRQGYEAALGTFE